MAGQRLLEQLIFIEPATGEVYAVDSAPYYAIESVWNASNYWVNLQVAVPLPKLSLDLSNTRKWECLLFDASVALAEQLEEVSCHTRALGR